MNVKTHPYRRFTALVLDDLCRRSGLSTAELVRRLKEELHRPTLSRQTLAAWRGGTQSTPAPVIWAVAAMVPVSPGEVSNLLAIRLLADPNTEEPMRGLIRRLYVPETSATPEN